VVATLGKLTEEDLATGWEDIEALWEGTNRAGTQMELHEVRQTAAGRSAQKWELADLSGLKVERVREFGSVYLALALWRRLAEWVDG
jgi:hypothetical protein